MSTASLPHSSHNPCCGWRRGGRFSCSLIILCPFPRMLIPIRQYCYVTHPSLNYGVSRNSMFAQPTTASTRSLAQVIVTVAGYPCCWSCSLDCAVSHRNSTTWPTAIRVGRSSGAARCGSARRGIGTCGVSAPHVAGVGALAAITSAASVVGSCCGNVAYTMGISQNKPQISSAPDTQRTIPCSGRSDSMLHVAKNLCGNCSSTTCKLVR